VQSYDKKIKFILKRCFTAFNITTVIVDIPVILDLPTAGRLGSASLVVQTTQHPSHLDPEIEDSRTPYYSLMKEQ